METMTTIAMLVAQMICPKSPGPAATQATNDITGYVLWGVIAIMALGIVVGVGAIAGGRLFSMPHASKVGVISIAVIFVAGIALLVLPGMFNAFIGTGCI
jgi:hypothetical protein